MYGIDLYCLLADTIAITFAGFFHDQPTDEEAPRLETVYDSKGEWVRQLKLFALISSVDGFPVWFDALDGGTGDSTTYAPQFEAFCEHV